MATAEIAACPRCGARVRVVLVIRSARHRRGYSPVVPVAVDPDRVETDSTFTLLPAYREAFAPEPLARLGLSAFRWARHREPSSLRFRPHAQTCPAYRTEQET